MLLSSKVIKQVPPELEDMPLYPKSYLPRKEQKDDHYLLIEQKEKEIDAVLKNAQVQADKLIKESQERASIIEEEAYQRGYLKGKEDGWQVGNSEARKISEAAKKVLEQAEDIRKQVYKNTEEELIGLAVEIAEKLICRQLETNTDTIMDIVQSVYNEAVDCQQVIIYTAPEAVEILEARKEEIGIQLYSTKRVQIISDPNITDGGCRVETEQGIIDATVPAMLEELKSVLKGGEGNECSAIGFVPAEA